MSLNTLRTYDGKDIHNGEIYFQIHLTTDGPEVSVQTYNAQHGFGSDWAHLIHSTRESADKLIAEQFQISTWFVQHAIRFCAKDKEGKTIIEESTINGILAVLYRWKTGENKPEGDLYIKGETIGNLFDKLSIANQRIWNAENIKRSQTASDKEIADATRLTNTINQQRNDLIQEIDERMNEIAAGKKQKLYKQGATKMYGK